MSMDLSRYMPRIRRRAGWFPRGARAVSLVTAAAIMLVMASFQYALATDLPTLKPGMSGDSVKTLQNNLVKRGYMQSADGKYGQATTDAVKLFQKQAGLTSDGVAGAQTQSLLYGLTGSGKTNITLRQGDKSDEVVCLQSRLSGLGYLNVSSPSENFGDKTKAAVTAFQKKAKLKADGVAGPQTLIKLYSSGAPKGSGAGSSTGSPDQNVLKLGMSGSEVRTLQNNLVKRGYMKSADGKFGSGTKAAVKQFQKNAGLHADGIAGQSTQDILYKLVGSGKTSQSLKSNMKGSQVKILQQRLIDLRYLRGASADGTFGATTKAAIVKFQQKDGLSADGVAGPKTLIKIYSPSAPVYMTKGEMVVKDAEKYLGVKYVYGAEDPSVGFDCSGLVCYVYKTYFGITLPRSAQGITKAGTAVKLSDARPGDILCFGNSISSVGHVGIYIGGNKFIEAPQTGDVVKITELHRAVATVRRIFTDD